MKPALLFSCLLSLSVVAVGGCGPSTTDPEPEAQRRPESFRAKFGALRRSRNLGAADELVVQQMMRTPDDPAILLLAARLSVEREDWTQADERFEALAAASGELSDDRWEEWMFAKTAGGDVMNVIRRLQAMPEKSDARWRLLGRLLSIVGDVWGAQAVDRRMVDRGIATPEELTSLLCLIKPRDSSDAVVDAALRRYPDDLRPRLAEVVRLWLSREKVEASRLNEQIVAEHPDYGPAVGLLAYLYADTLQLESLGELIAKQDPASLDRPEFWYALGLYRQQAGQTEAAVASLLQSAADPFVAMIASGRLATGLGGLGL